MSPWPWLLLGCLLFWAGVFVLALWAAGAVS